MNKREIERKTESLARQRTFAFLEDKVNRAEDEIIKRMTVISGKYSPDMVFTDWVQCMALSIQNSCCMLHDKVWKYREEQYLNLVKRYEKNEIREFVNMMNLLCEALEEEIADILGAVYMKAGCGSKQTGQFFTPFHLSALTAELSLPVLDENNVYELNEPSCGGGGMIIGAAAGTMKQVVTTLLNDEAERKPEAGYKEYTKKEIGSLISQDNIIDYAIAVLKAYGLSLPEPNEEDDYPNEESGNMSESM